LTSSSPKHTARLQAELRLSAGTADGSNSSAELTDIPVASTAEHPPATDDKPARKRGRPRRSGVAVITPLKLLDSAEEQFAERGFYGVTTRQVAEAAGCDDSLIYYHFANKRGLFEAVLERRSPVINEVRRLSLRAYADANPGGVTVRGAVAAYLDPMFDLSESGDRGWKNYFAMVAQIDNTNWGGEIIHRFFDPAVYELISVIKLALPDVPDRELYWAYNFLAGSMMIALAEAGRVEQLSFGLCKADDLSEVRHRLIDYCAGGFAQMVASAKASGITNP
jgi:AcrR family transcriptional regulator